MTEAMNESSDHPAPRGPIVDYLECWFIAYVEHAVNVGTSGAPKDPPEILRVRGGELVDDRG